MMKRIIPLMIAAVLFAGLMQSQTTDFSGAKIICSEKTDKLVLKAVAVLQEEIQKRSKVKLPVFNKPASKPANQIFVGTESRLKLPSPELSKQLSQMDPSGNEGFKLLSDGSSIIIAGYDARGVLYGVGKLLRTLELGPGKIKLTKPLRMSSAPVYPIRGHQMGYRPKTNANGNYELTMHGPLPNTKVTSATWQFLEPTLLK